MNRAFVKRAALAAGRNAALAFACLTGFAAPAPAGQWQNVGLDMEIDLQSVQPAASGFTATLRRTDLKGEGMPPPAARATQHYRFDCETRTAEALDIDIYDAAGKRIGGGPYPPGHAIAAGPGSIPGRIEALVCPTLHAR